MKYYSPSTKGFYDIEFHGDNIPDDVVEITDQYHSELLEKQSQGYNIVFDGANVVTEKVITPQDELALAYRYDRISEYPDMGDQLDMLWHMMDNETLPGKGSEWYNTILQVKAKYPKP